MNNRSFHDESRGIERLVIIIFAMYCIFVSIVTILLDKYLFTVVITVMGWCISYIFFVKKYLDYKTRAFMTATLMLIGIFLYSIQINDLYISLPILMAAMVVIQIYGIPEMMFIVFAGVVVVVGYHVSILHNVELNNMEQWIHFLFMLIHIMVMFFVIYMLLKKRQENQQELSGIIEELVSAEKSKDEFLANVSHELRTPLNTICGLSELSLKETDLKIIRENLYHIHESGHNLITAVGDILDYSSIINDQLILEEENYPIVSTAMNLVETMMAKRDGKNLEMIVDIDPSLPGLLYGDEKKIRHAIMNLIDNAIKFTNDGSVCMEVTYRRESYGINLIFVVRDTGIGMSQVNTEKLFRKFSQADASTSRQKEGLGLGLAISNAIIRKMGGVITVQSEYGKGTTMRVSIPQKVLDEHPIVSVEHVEELHVAVYLNPEKFQMMDTRDEYTRLIHHVLQGIQVKYHICHNVNELMRRDANDDYTHLFITLSEYLDNPGFFDDISKKMKVVLLSDHSELPEHVQSNMYILEKPYHVVSIVQILNESSRNSGGVSNMEKFVAPEAHILVVDDNEMNLTVVERILKSYQIKVTKANSGREALEKIESKEFDFVFMDYMMPEMDGIETKNRIREKMDNYYKRIPIVALTANAVAGAREMFLEEGFADYIEKPIEIPVLERVLRRNLPESKLLPVTKEYKEENIPEEKTVVTPAASATLQEKPEQTEEFIINRANGIAYCGGEEGYIEIVQSCIEGCRDNVDEMEEAYQKEDWKNYTILVHALKSTMRTIGLDAISEMAKGLEFAGKENNIDWIHNRHEETMKAYVRAMNYMKSLPEFGMEQKVEENEDVTGDMISEEELLHQLKQFEEAVFSFDESAMNAVLEHLTGCQFKHVVLGEKISGVKGKINKSDYLSALDDLTKIVEKVRKEE